MVAPAGYLPARTPGDRSVPEQMRGWGARAMVGGVSPSASRSEAAAPTQLARPRTLLRAGKGTHLLGAPYLSGVPARVPEPHSDCLPERRSSAHSRSRG